MTDRIATIQVNGQMEDLSASSLAALLEEREIADARGVAIALNGLMVPRTAWPQTPLRAGDVVEIVRARQGG
jgi:sulfur carrier protein